MIIDQSTPPVKRRLAGTSGSSSYELPNLRPKPNFYGVKLPIEYFDLKPSVGASETVKHEVHKKRRGLDTGCNCNAINNDSRQVTVSNVLEPEFRTIRLVKR